MKHSLRHNLVPSPWQKRQIYKKLSAKFYMNINGRSGKVVTRFDWHGKERWIPVFSWKHIQTSELEECPSPDGILFSLEKLFLLRLIRSAGWKIYQVWWVLHGLYIWWVLHDNSYNQSEKNFFQNNGSHWKNMGHHKQKQNHINIQLYFFPF